MAVAYYQIGPDVLKAPYTGEDPVQALYEGQINTVANQALAGAAGDTLELVLCEIPAGVLVYGVMWAISASIAAANLTAKFSLRKKATNALVNNTGLSGFIGDAYTTGGAPDIATLALNGSAIAVNANTNGSVTVIPTQVEGLTPAKSVTQEAYYLSLVLTSSTATVTLPATPVTIWAGIEGKFVGNL